VDQGSTSKARGCILVMPKGFILFGERLSASYINPS
jgi:hypothetical protein